jgi:phosphate transport system substrate-binding protein
MKFLPLVSLLGILVTGSAARGEVPAITLAGSSTVTRVLLPLKAGVEASQGVEIRLVPNGSGRGLADLAAGRADAAMLSGPLDYLLERVNASAPGGLRSEQLEKLKLADTPKAEVVALLAPGNPVRQLTALQLRDLLSGAIVNWRQIGGPDLPVQVILADELDGVRASLASGLMAGTTFVASAKIVERTPDIVALVVATPGGVGMLPRSTLRGDSVWAEIEPKLSLALHLVARRDRLEANPKLETVLNSLHSRAR